MFRSEIVEKYETRVVFDGCPKGWHWGPVGFWGNLRVVVDRCNLDAAFPIDKNSVFKCEMDFCLQGVSFTGPLPRKCFTHLKTCQDVKYNGLISVDLWRGPCVIITADELNKHWVQYPVDLMFLLNLNCRYNFVLSQVHYCSLCSLFVVTPVA